MSDDKYILFGIPDVRYSQVMIQQFGLDVDPEFEASVFEKAIADALLFRDLYLKAFSPQQEPRGSMSAEDRRETRSAPAQRPQNGNRQSNRQATQGRRRVRVGARECEACGGEVKPSAEKFQEYRDDGTPDKWFHVAGECDETGKRGLYYRQTVPIGGGDDADDLPY